MSERGREREKERIEMKGGRENTEVESMSLRNGGNDVGVGVKGDRLEVRKSSIIFYHFHHHLHLHVQVYTQL